MSNWEAPSAGQLLPLQRTLTLHWGAQFLPRVWERLHGRCPDDEAAGNWEGGPRCLRAEGWAVPGVGEGGPREVTPGLTKMTVTSLGRRRWLGQVRKIPQARQDCVGGPLAWGSLSSHTPLWAWLLVACVWSRSWPGHLHAAPCPKAAVGGGQVDRVRLGPPVLSPGCPGWREGLEPHSTGSSSPPLPEQTKPQVTHLTRPRSKG